MRSKRSHSKNSAKVISAPSHKRFIVRIVGEEFLRERILLTVDCVTLLIIQSLLTDIFLSLHISSVGVAKADQVIDEFDTYNPVSLIKKWNRPISDRFWERKYHILLKKEKTIKVI